ncbi:MAG: phytoene/squalene synthase family protein [Bacteroidota bacterium]
MELYSKNAFAVSRLTTRNYSTSFSLGVRLLDRRFRDPIYAIYGFVRYADEIVDTLDIPHKKELLERFREETFTAIREGISTNPVLQSFQYVVNEYSIQDELIEAFLKSMEMDLYRNSYDEQGYQDYIYGSAAVVGLMCLRVFYRGQDEEYRQLAGPARKLGEAFQKVNFLRDIRSDYRERGRIYFPGVDLDEFNEDTKKLIEEDIQADFDEAYQGIVRLNKASQLGVLISYAYYLALFRKIRHTAAGEILKKRYRISNFRKILIMISCWFRVKTGLIR